MIATTYKLNFSTKKDPQQWDGVTIMACGYNAFGDPNRWIVFEGNLILTKKGAWEERGEHSLERHRFSSLSIAQKTAMQIFNQ